MLRATLLTLVVVLAISTGLLLLRSINSAPCLVQDGRRWCDLGGYVAATPVDRTKASITLVLKGHQTLPVVEVSSERTLVFDADGKGDTLLASAGQITLADAKSNRVLLDLHQPASGRHWFSYAAYDSSRDAWVENLDNGPDGTLDLRRTDVPGHPLKTEFRIGEQWFERIDRDGKAGAVVNGQWTDVDEIRARFDAEKK